MVPGKTLNEVSKILPGDADSDVTISFTEKHIVFEFDKTVVVSRLIEGEYFKIDHPFGGDRPSQTPRLTLSHHRFTVTG